MELLRLVAFGIRTVSSNASDIDETARCIQCAVSNNLIIQARGNGIYRFTHDSFQHYFCNPTEKSSEQQHIHLRIGRALMPQSTSDCNEKFALLAASNLVRSNPRENIRDKFRETCSDEAFHRSCQLGSIKSLGCGCERVPGVCYGYGNHMPGRSWQQVGH